MRSTPPSSEIDPVASPRTATFADTTSVDRSPSASVRPTAADPSSPTATTVSSHAPSQSATPRCPRPTATTRPATLVVDDGSISSVPPSRSAHHVGVPGTGRASSGISGRTEPSGRTPAGSTTIGAHAGVGASVASGTSSSPGPGSGLGALRTRKRSPGPSSAPTSPPTRSGPLSPSDDAGRSTTLPEATSISVTEPSTSSTAIVVSLASTRPPASRTRSGVDNGNVVTSPAGRARRWTASTVATTTANGSASASDGGTSTVEAPATSSDVIAPVDASDPTIEPGTLGSGDTATDPDADTDAGVADAVGRPAPEPPAGVEAPPAPSSTGARARSADSATSATSAAIAEAAPTAR